jgi:Sec-independent protein translocase protein TatA
MGPAGLGFQEILVIAVLLLIFVRPEEIPAIFRKIGKIWAKIYYYYTLARRELRSMEKDIGIDEEMKEIRAMNGRMRSEITNFDRTVKEDIITTNTDKEE